MSPVEDTPVPTDRSRATMRDVAALAGVSLKTVSRVVNDESGVREEVRRKVGDAAARLAYRHHRGASDLRRREQRTGVIGVLLQDVANDFAATLLRSLEDSAGRHGLVLLAASLDEDAARERTVVAEMVSRRVDGLVIMPASARQEYLAVEQRAGMPMVFVDRPPVGLDADSVRIDNAAGARLAVEHLVAQGHRRVAFLSDLTHLHTAVERRLGWSQALAAAGLEADPALALGDLRDVLSAREALARLLALPDPPTAVFAARNVLAVGALQAIREHPAPVALVGFDDFFLADLLDPPVSVVRQDVAELGRVAADLLAERLGGSTVAPRHVVLTPELVVRGSSTVPVLRREGGRADHTG